MRLLVLALLVVGCEPASRYRPVRAGLGYDDMQISDRSYEVRFESGTRSEAHMGALRRAAEIAIKRGFFGFVARTDDHQENMTVRRRAVIGHARSVSDMTVIVVDMLTEDEFEDADVPGATLYQAAVVMHETNRMDVGAHPWKRKRPRTIEPGQDSEDPH